METRELRYFVAVAEEGHVGRAAERLGIAQPPLSRAVQQLERRLGVQLLTRSSRGVTLTGPGEVLLAEGRAALAAMEAAGRRAVRAAGAPGLVLATKAGASSELLAKLLAAYAAEPGSVHVEVSLCGIGEQGAMVRDGRADVALLHRPFDSVAGLDVEELGTEGQVLVVPAGHPVTLRARLRLDEADGLEGLPPLRWRRPDGTYPPGPGAEIREHVQMLQLVGLGRGSVLLPESVRPLLGSDLAAVPVVDAPLVTTVIAWPSHSRSRAVADLVRTATRLSPWPSPARRAPFDKLRDRGRPWCLPPAAGPPPPARPDQAAARPRGEGEAMWAGLGWTSEEHAAERESRTSPGKVRRALERGSRGLRPCGRVLDQRFSGRGPRGSTRRPGPSG